MTAYLIAGIAALVAGAVNAIAGGGSFISFPALVATGLPPVIASLTNTVAMCPGYFGAAIAQRRDLAGQRRRVLMLLPFSVVGGVGGALLLLNLDATAFDRVVPVLLLVATILIAAQDWIRKRLFKGERTGRADAWAIVPVLIAGVYGGYFGAAMGVIVVAALGIVIDDSLTRVNALKQTVTLAVNVAAATVFIVSGRVHWPLALTMMAAALVGGLVGGALASRIPARALRIMIVVVGVVVSALYFSRW